jgi:hypothetical protein
MGSCISIKELDHDRIRSEIVLESKGETCRYHGTTERARFQVYLFNFLLLIILIYF